MPLIVCNTRAGMDVALKAKLAGQITNFVHDTIKADFYHISVMFNDLAAESSYVAGRPGRDTLIICNIREGRTDPTKLNLSMGISSLWHELTRQPLDEVEVAVLEYRAEFVVRGGKPMPAPARV